MATSRTASVFQLGVRFQDGTLQTTAAFGTVTSVAMTGDGVIFNATVGGSPITVAGTLVPALLTQTANRILAGPTSGGAATPTFRALVTADLPAGTGTVTSVAMTGDNVIYATAVGGSPITTSGTLVPALKTQTANFMLAGPTSGGAATPTFRALVAADIPALSYVTSVALTVPSIFSISGSPITSSGTLAIGLQTQTANTVWAGPTSGGAATPTFRALVAADISGLVSTAWSSITAAAADLTLANTTFNTTFNHTAATNWKWTNTTAATSSLNGLSPILSIFSQVWTNGADTQSGYSIQNKITTAPNNKTITNSSENASNTVTLTVGAAHGFVALQRVTFIGLTTMTWINNVTVIITSVTATTILFQDPTSHGTSASHADTGTTTLVPPMELTFTPVGTAGDTRMMFPVLSAANGNVGVGGFGFIGQAANCGYGPISLTTGGLACYTGLSGGGSSTSVFGIYRISAAPAANAPTQQVASWEFGDNSDGNSTSLITANVGGFSVGLQGSRTTAAQTGNPCVVLGNNSNTIVNTSATMIGVGIGYGKAITTAFNFAPTSGTGVFQCTVIKYTVNQTGGANGNITGLIVNAVETAVGGTHLLLDLQAGTTGGTSKFAINNSGVCTKYAGITTVSQGHPAEYATVDLTAQTAAIAATTAYAVPAGGTGMYRISWSADITTVATTSSILGGANGFQVVFTSPTDSVVKTTVAGNSVTSAANTTGTAVGGSIVVYAKTGTNIQYSFDYTSVGGTPMAYELHIKVEAL